MDRITIADLEVAYHLGVPDAERARPQRLLLTLELGLDFTPAAATDDLAQTVDYFALVGRIKELGAGREWRLIEKLAADVAALAMAEMYSPTSSGSARFTLNSTHSVSPGS